jgi:hypothetical protein
LAEGFGQPIDNAALVLPGLDLAVAVRQLYDQKRHIDALRMICTSLDVDLKRGIEWYTALTGWQSVYTRPAAVAFESEAALRARLNMPAALTAQALGGALAVTLEQLARRIEDNAKSRHDYAPNVSGPWGAPLMIAHEIRAAAAEVRHASQQ